MANMVSIVASEKELTAGYYPEALRYVVAYYADENHYQIRCWYNLDPPYSLGVAMELDLPIIRGSHFVSNQN